MVSKGKVKGVRKGACKLQAAAAETTTWLALNKTHTLKVTKK